MKQENIPKKMERVKFKPQIIVKGATFNWVKTQRDGFTAVYKGESSFLKIGLPEKIKRNLILHKKSEESGFPVASLLDEGQIEGMYYYIESSLGEDNFSALFKKEFKEHGRVSDETFDKFISICERFTRSQLKTNSKQKDWDSFCAAIHLDTICDELPKYREKILDTYKKTEAKLSVFPFVLTHGDFTLNNIFPEGIIDVENACLGPAGYDIGVILLIPDWIPNSKEYESYPVYKLTPKQKQKFLDKIDGIYVSNSLPRVSNYMREINFLVGIWRAANMDRFQKLQNFRFSLLKGIIDKRLQSD